MIVDAYILYWTPRGMSLQPDPFGGRSAQYIERSEVERLLEEADRRGYRRGYQHGKESLNLGAATPQTKGQQGGLR